MSVTESELADLRLGSLLDQLCQEAERIQFDHLDTADLLWEAARRLEIIQKESRLLGRIIDG